MAHALPPDGYGHKSDGECDENGNPMAGNVAFFRQFATQLGAGCRFRSVSFDLLMKASVHKTQLIVAEIEMGTNECAKGETTMEIGSQMIATDIARRCRHF
jgi:hypothetical protein